MPRRRASLVQIATALARIGLAVLVGLLVAAACGSDGPASPPSDCTRIRGAAFTLVARNIQWSTDCLEVPARSSVTFTVDLRDDVQHNLHISGPSGNERTPLERGPGRQTLDFDFDTPGLHLFVCDIHPAMEGDLFVTQP